MLFLFFVLQLPPGASPAMVSKLLEAEVSKSAVRRRRRKQGTQEYSGDNNNDNEVTEVDESPVPLTQSVPVIPLSRAPEPQNSFVSTSVVRAPSPIKSSPQSTEASVHALVTAPKHQPTPVPAVAVLPQLAAAGAITGHTSSKDAFVRPATAAVGQSATISAPVAAVGKAVGGYFKSKSGLNIRL